MRRSGIALFLFGVLFLLPAMASGAGIKVEGESTISRFIVPDGISLPTHAASVGWEAYSNGPAAYVDLPMAITRIARDMATVYGRFGFVYLLNRVEVSLVQFDDGDHYFINVSGFLWPAEVPEEPQIFLEQLSDRVTEMFGAARLYGLDLVAARLGGVECANIKFSLALFIVDFQSDYLKLEGNVTTSCIEAAGFRRSLGVPW